MDASEITELLQLWHLDNDTTWHQLVPLIYEEMRRLARYHLNQRGESAEFQTTELLHETLMRLEQQDRVQWSDRKHFFAVATTLMRRVLLDHARERRAGKRGALAVHVPIQARDLEQPIADHALIALDQALTDLARMDPSLAKLVELRVFGGLTIAESGRVMECSPATIKREWQTARLWLFDYLSVS